MKLFRVDLELAMYVFAKDQQEAELEARTYMSEEEPSFVSAAEMRKVEDVEEDWKDSIPYGGPEDQTCRQILEVPVVPEPYDDPAQLKIDFGKQPGNEA